MAQQPLQVSRVTIAAPNPRELASFYQRLLGWTVSALEDPRPGEAPQAGWAQLQNPSAGPGSDDLNIEFAKEYIRPVWPSAPGQQHITAHLDIPVGDLNTAVAEARDAGATLAEVQPQDDVRVMLDPAGHPSCLFLTA